MDKEKLFSQTFKVLLTLTICIWAIYFMLLAFAETRQACDSGAVSRLVSQFAWLSGLLSIPPIAYGLTRLLSTPGGPKNSGVALFGLLISLGAAIFVGALIVFALALAQYGCR